MRPAGHLLLLLIASPAGVMADEPAPATPPRTSARLSQEIRATLPKFTPPATPPAATGPVAAPATPRDPDVLELPKITVLEKRIPTNDPDVWLTERALRQKSMAAYRDSMTDLEWALNSWFYIPLFGTPPSVRARRYYESRKLADEIDRLNNIVKAISLSDSREADKMRQAMDPRKLPKDD